MIFILDSVKDTDFYKKNRVPRTTDSRLVELATKLQSLDSLALFYFSSLLLLIIAIHLTFVFVRWFKKRVDVFRKTRYDVINYRLVKVTTKSDDNDGKKGEVDNSPLRAFQELFQPTPEKELKVPESAKNGTTTKTKTPSTPPPPNTDGTKKEGKKSPLRKLSFENGKKGEKEEEQKQNSPFSFLNNLFPEPNYVGYVTNADKTYTTVLMKDQTKKRKERRVKFIPDFVADKIKTQLLCDERDWPLVETLASVCVYLPLSIFLLVTVINIDELKNRKRDHFVGFVWLVVTRALFGKQFMSVLSKFTKYDVFKGKSARFLNRVPSILLAPAFGVPSGVYFFHRSAVMPDECAFDKDQDRVRNAKVLASTSKYQRDSISQFIMYWIRNAVFGPIELTLWVYKNRSVKDALKTVVGFYFSYSMYAFLKMQSPIAAFWTFFLPWVLSTWDLSFENWSKHMFITPRESNSVWAKNFTIINTNENQKSFNDGYKLLEHIYTGANSLDLIHWSEFPEKFLENRSQYGDHKTFVFTGISREEVAMLVFFGHLRKLATKCVDVGQGVGGKSYDDMVQAFEERLRPIIPEAKKDLNGFDAIVDFFENLFPADMFGNQENDINSNAKKSSATTTDKAVVTPKEKTVGAKQATTPSSGISLSGIFDYPDAARDESEVALTYMNKKKNNFDSVMGLKPQSPAKERNKRDTENITP